MHFPTKKILILFVSLFLCGQAFPQPSTGGNVAYDLSVNNVIPPTPEAAAISKFIDIPTDNYTGTPRVSIPLFGVEGRELGMNLSLDYHASGLKVGEVPSWVGAGWSLGGLGVISRTVRGMADFPGAGPQHDGLMLDGGILDMDECELGTGHWRLMNGCTDTEPDIWFFSTPDGKQGKFVYDHNGRIHMLPYRNVEVDYDSGRWTVRSGDGISYVYGRDIDSDMPRTDIMNISGNCTGMGSIFCHPDGSGYQPVSTWYLTAMVSPGGTDTIRFEYLPESYSYQDNAVLNHTRKVSGTIGETSSDPSVCTNTISVEGWKPSAISTSTGITVEFIAGDMRADLPGSRKLARIIKKSGGEIMHDFELGQTYFKNIDNPTALDSDVELRLDSVRDAVSQAPPHTMDYFGDMRPPRTSLDRDAWGFYQEPSPMPYSYIRQSNLGGEWYRMDSYNRGGPTDFNIESAMLGTLRRLHFPTGGFTELEFEPHTYHTFPSDHSHNSVYLVTGEESVPFSMSYNEGGQYHKVSDPFTLDAEMEVSVAPGPSGLMGNFPIDEEYANAYIKICPTSCPPGELGDCGDCIEVRELPKKLPADEYVIIARMQNGYAYSPEGDGENSGNTPGNAENFDSLNIHFSLRWDDFDTNEWMEGIPGGGFRIRSIRTKENQDSEYEMVREYEYRKPHGDGVHMVSSGKLRSAPQFSYYTLTDNLIPKDAFGSPINLEYTVLFPHGNGNSGYFPGPPTDTGIEVGVMETISRTSLRQLGQLQGSHVGYDRVTEYMSRVEPGNTFTGYHGMNEYTYSNIGHSELAAGPSFESFPFSPPSHIDDDSHGMLISQASYERSGDSYVKLTETANTYEEMTGFDRKGWDTGYEPAYGHRYARRYSSACYYCYDPGDGGTNIFPTHFEEYFPLDLPLHGTKTYEMHSRWFALKESTTTVYGEGIPMSTVTSYSYGDRHQSPVAVTKDYGGETMITETKYSSDYDADAAADGNSLAIREMRERNMSGVPIERRTYRDRGQGKKLIGADLYYFELLPSGHILPRTTYKAEIADPVPAASFAESGIGQDGVFTRDGTYEPQMTVSGYDAFGNITGYAREHHNPNAFIWGYGKTVPVAGVVNAEPSETAYTGFESIGDGSAPANGNWEVSAGGWDSGFAKTGESFYRPTSDRTVSVTMPQQGGYRLSFWHRGRLKVMNGGGQHDQTEWESSWSYYETDVYITQGGVLSIEGVSNNAAIDELRLHPADALMETYCYDSETRRLTDSNTANGISARYEYDASGRLEYVYDRDGNIVANYGYLYHDNLDNPSGKNLVRTRTVLTEGLTDKSTFVDEFENLPQEDKKETVQYLDGLGRPIQSIAVGQSLKETINGTDHYHDIVSVHDYDDLGREARQYLPFVAEGNNGDFVQNALSLQSSWYASNPYNMPNDGKIAETSHPYAETVFGASPLSRVTEQGAPGADWQPGTGHTVRSTYGVNSGQEGVHDFQTGSTASAANTYGAGELSFVATTDGNGNKTETYTDKQGRTILVRRKMIVTNTQGTSVSSYVRDVDTYNIYNDFGLLEAVVPPNTVKAMETSGNWDYAAHAGSIYSYEYDHRLRLVRKTLPDAGSTAYSYDRRDQLVLTQDENQAGDGTTVPEYSYTKYDILGRPVETGIYTPTGTALATGEPSSMEIAGLPYESGMQGGDGYTNNAFPTDGRDVLTLSYYDDYDFENDGSTSVSYQSGQDADLPSEYFNRLDGQLTATKVSYVEDGMKKWLTTATFYDDRMRVVQIRSRHHMGYWDTNSTIYDFAGKVLRTKHTHRMVEHDGVVRNRGYVEKFEYDHAGRVKDVRYKARNDREIIRSSSTYNELGQLIEKNLHDADLDNDADTRHYLQSIDYRYNIRGWMESINDTYLPSSQENVYTEIGGGKYHVTATAVSFGEWQILLEKEIDAVPVGQATPVTEVESRTLTVMSDATITDFDIDIATVNIAGIGDIGAAVDVLSTEIADELDGQGLSANKTVSAPITKTLLDMAKATWYMVEDSYDPDEADLYSQRLYYNRDNSQLGSSAQYNGNISSTVWQVKGKDRQAYGFEYDDLDRLTKATHSFIDAQNNYLNDGTYDVPEIGYDLNGNITSLRRNGIGYEPSAPDVPVFGEIDDLVYSYTSEGNRLLGVQDALELELLGGFDETGTGTDVELAVEYEYDANGNMVLDRNKGLRIEYNHLNLPVLFGWDDDSDGQLNREIRILYDAAGVKLRKTVIDNDNPGDVTVRDYVGGMEYKDGLLDAVYHADGRCIPTQNYDEYELDGEVTSDYFVYEYTIKDHLGNARVSFADWDNSGGIEVAHGNPSETEITSEHHYYPFGAEMEMPTTQVGTPNNYTYNGKEFNDDFGLDLSDYGARWYDASIGRWHSVDPLAETMNSWSPYNYTFGNPMNFTDPTGMAPEGMYDWDAHDRGETGIYRNGNGDRITFDEALATGNEMTDNEGEQDNLDALRTEFRKVAKQKKHGDYHTKNLMNYVTLEKESRFKTELDDFAKVILNEGGTTTIYIEIYMNTYTSTYSTKLQANAALKMDQALIKQYPKQIQYLYKLYAGKIKKNSKGEYYIHRLNFKDYLKTYNLLKQELANRGVNSGKLGIKTRHAASVENIGYYGRNSGVFLYSVTSKIFAESSP